MKYLQTHLANEKKYINTMQSKLPLNEKGNNHGKWVVYHQYNGQLYYICNYIDGEWYGYFEIDRFGSIDKEYSAR